MTLDLVRDRIAQACSRVGRDPDGVTLVAVSKGRPDSAVEAAYNQGQRVFGENRQQGLAARVEGDLPDDVEWHFIGPLQRRKARFVAANAQLLHSFDRLELIERWRGSPTPVLLQFNMAAEPQKGGFAPADADRVFAAVRDAEITVRGVMAIPPIVADPDDARPWFQDLANVFDRLRGTDDTVDTLSMGMSHDYEVAIEEGATMVRVGTAIFGPVEHNASRNG